MNKKERRAYEQKRKENELALLAQNEIEKLNQNKNQSGDVCANDPAAGSAICQKEEVEESLSAGD